MIAEYQRHHRLVGWGAGETYQAARLLVQCAMNGAQLTNLHLRWGNRDARTSSVLCTELGGMRRSGVTNNAT